MRSLIIVALATFCLLSASINCQKEEEHDGISLKIPLMRQKWPRQSAMEYELRASDDRGFLPAFLKPKPKPPISNATVALYRYLDSEFYGIINIGHQQFRMLFDTTWVHSWILSEMCPTTQVGCWFHNLYDSKTSPTYAPNGTKFTTNDKYYNISGFYSYEKFVIGQVSVPKQQFIEVTQLPYYNVFSKHDGVVGLGLKVDGYDPWFYNVLRAKEVKFTKTLFSIYLNRDEQSNKGGAIMLGAVDYKHVHHVDVNGTVVYDTITYVPIKPNVQYWQFKMDNVYLTEAKKDTYVCENGCDAMPDTTSNMITVPPKVSDKIHAAIRAKHLMFGYYEVNCETIAKLPTITFTINGRPFSLKGSQYTQLLSYRSFRMCLSSFHASQADVESNTWIVGAAFLTQYYTIYDIDNKRLGFVRSH